MYHDAFLSILGLYEYDGTLFDNMKLPSIVDRQTVIENIIMECAELELIYSDADFMKYAIGQWSKMYIDTWTRIAENMQQEFNVLWNYDRDETWTETRQNAHDENGTTNGQINSTSHTEGKQIDSVTGYNTDDFANANKTETTNDQTNDETNANEYQTKSNDDEIIKHVHNAHGNIGVTTASQMITQDNDMRLKYNINRIIIDSFKKRFCLLVY